MKKKYIMILLSLMVVLSACGKRETEESSEVVFGEISTEESTETEEETEETTETVEESEPESDVVSYDIEDIDKYVTLGEYKHVIDLTEEDITATEEEIDNEVELQLESYSYPSSQQVTGTVNDGDTVNVDYTLTIDGFTLTYDDINIDIGSDMIVAGVDDQLKGMATGEDMTYDTVFPDDYVDPNLAGRNVTVYAKVNYIIPSTTVSALTDDFVKDFTDGEYDTVEAYRESIKAELNKSKISNYNSTVFDKVFSNAKISGDISALVEQEYQTSLEDMTTYAETYGIEEDEMYTMYGYSSWDELYDYLEESSEEYVKEKLVLYKLADVLGITLTRQDYEDYNDDLREQYTEEELTELQSDDYTTYSILYDKVTTELVYLQISE